MSWKHVHGFNSRWQNVNGNRFVRVAVPALLGLDMVSASCHHYTVDVHVSHIKRQVSARQATLANCDFDSVKLQVHNLYLVHSEWRKSLLVSLGSTQPNGE